MKEKKQAPSIRRKKPILPIALILAAAVVLALLPQLAERRNVQENPSIVAAQAQAAQIDTVIHAGGTLTDHEAESISVPEDVELNFVVKNGDTVKAGDLIASVDKESLMITIAKLQANLESMDERIEKAMEDSETARVEAPASGRIKAIYAQSGENVTDVMYEHGALAVLSLDGSMALNLPWSDATVGTPVTVTLADGTEVSARVDALSGGMATIVLSDEKAALGETVSVTDSEGNALGGGALSIHQPLAVTGYYGQVEELCAELDEQLEAGDTLMTLVNAESTAGYAGLLSQRQQMEQQMTELFALYQTGGLFAERDGIVAEISDEDNLEAVMAAQASYALRAMTHSPDGLEGYTNYAAAVTGIQGVNLSLNLCPVTISDLDYADTQLLESLPYTQITGYTLPENTMVYIRENDAWVLKNLAEIQVGDKLILAFGDTPEAPVWIVCHHASASTPETGVTNPTDPEGDAPGKNETPAVTTPAAPDAKPQKPDTSETVPEQTTPTAGEAVPEQTTPTAGEAVPEQTTPNAGEAVPEQTTPNAGEAVTGQTNPGAAQGHSQGSQSNAGINGALASGVSGSLNADVMTRAEAEAAADLILTETVAYTLTPDTDMTVELMIDEMDLAKIQVGQKVSLVLDALPEAELSAVVTAIADTSASESGSAKFAVEITLDRLLEMRSGMNAAVTIPVSTLEAACTVPAAALVEKGGETMVYTSYDRETDTLGNPVTVTTGVSDGETVEILSGLSAGDTVYYSYTEVIEYDFVQ